LQPSKRKTIFTKWRYPLGTSYFRWLQRSRF